MPYERFQQHVVQQLDQIRAAGLLKGERILTSPQRAHVAIAGRRELLNMCATTISAWPTIRPSAPPREALDKWGYGMASVRFICGTQELHKQLESSISRFLGTDDAILYSSCWDANGGLFETILGAEDAVISDELNHASIIDGIRLCKAQRLRYRNNDMSDLEAKLQESRGARFRLIATDGVFSMDGIIANLPGICDLADRHDAMVMIDDSHAAGFLGPRSAELPTTMTSPDASTLSPARSARRSAAAAAATPAAEGKSSSSSASIAPVSLLQFASPAHRRCFAGRDRATLLIHRAARPA